MSATLIDGKKLSLQLRGEITVDAEKFQKENGRKWSEKYRRKTTGDDLWATEKDAILNADVEAAMRILTREEDNVHQ